ncbi:PLAC8 family-domain-containing protein [Geopyxis carbonaria]|nr:PLAC8 family-domain-containing protein [Geopyxis carbonaria]
MSAPSDPTDSKSAPLLAGEDAPVDAPPSYTPSSAGDAAKPVFGDGNVYSDLPRPGAMRYSAAARQAYTPRAERPGWRFGMFSCLGDCETATKTFCCPCVTYGQTRHRLRAPGTPAPIFSTPCLGYLLTGMAFPGAQHVFGLLQRNELRARLNIDQPETPDAGVRLGRSGGSGGTAWFENVQHALGFADDAWRHVFCACCALVQEEREVREWEREVAEDGGLEGLEARGSEGLAGREGEEGAVREEGERLLGAEQEGLRGLRG